jgi:antirestriction protein ArdC
MARKKTRKGRRPPTEAERAERRERDRALMAEAVEELRTSEGWGRWLRARRHFHKYSFRNQLLIALQRPGATRVCGFAAWLKLGYAVQKGEHGSYIWAPCRPSRRRMREWEEAGADPAKKPRTFYKLVKVWDRSQVAPLPDFPGGPAPLDPPGHPVEGDGLADRLPALVGFAEELGLEVVIEPIPGAASGYHEPATGRIVIEETGPAFSANAQVAVLIHETAHALVRHDRREDDPRLTYAEEECVVECVAFGVCASAGLDTSGASVPYVAGWGVGGEIGRYAALIDRLASRIEEAVGGPRPRSAEEGMAIAAL